MPAAPATALHDLPAAPLCVGYSGGLDSTVLLHLLATSRPAHGLRAIHVHHGLHPDADRWSTHCEAACAALGVELTVIRVKVAATGAGPEAAAREARHAAFASALASDEVLALAHHSDDQAETFLLRALRASGPDGLTAMRRWRTFGRGRLWRPLLDIDRDALLAYAHAHGLAWIEDPSNADTAFDRNFLRTRVMPLLRERWPHVSEALARSAALCEQADALLDDEDAQALANVGLSDPRCLSRMGLLALPESRRARVLRRWIDALGLPALPANGIERIEREILDARDDAEPVFQWHGTVVRAWRDLLFADVARAPLPADWHAEWDGRAPLVLPGGDVLALDGTADFDTPLRVHARQGGERLMRAGRSHSHALKQVLQELGIPPWERERLPLLSDGAGELLAAGDLVHSARFDAWLRGRGARLAWRRQGETHAATARDGN